MYKLISSSIIVAIFMATISFSFVYSDENPINDICSISLCAEVRTCPIGTYLKPARPNDGVCCDTCAPYAKLGENCNDTISCSPNLICPIPFGASHTPDNVCTYYWDSQNSPGQCDTTFCPTYAACPNGSFLLQHGGQVCCDKCILFSRYGEHCDDVLPCVSGLNCKNNFCMESDLCAEKKNSCDVVTKCGLNEYLVPADGVENCCDTCKPYAKLGEKCDNNQFCDLRSYCDYSTHTCVKSQVACSCFESKQEDCTDEFGVWVPSSEANCCAYCQRRANYGELCDEENPCITKFLCKNNKCALADNCV